MSVRSINGGGPFRYPSPLGDVHVGAPLDEITLVRIIHGLEDCNLEPRQVLNVRIHGPSLMTFEYMVEPMMYNVNGDIVRHFITTRSRPATGLEETT